jgi:hypothetical protein
MAKQTSNRKKNPFARHKLTAIAAGTVLSIAGTVGVVRRVVTPGENVKAVIDGDSFKIDND